jgi:hypothetical protein
MVVEFASNMAVCSEVYLHRAPLPAQKAAIEKCRRIRRIMSNAIWNSQHLLNSILRHALSDLIESVPRHGIAENEVNQKAYDRRHEKNDDQENSKSAFHGESRA